MTYANGRKYKHKHKKSLKGGVSYYEREKYNRRRAARYRKWLGPLTWATIAIVIILGLSSELLS